MRVLPALRRLLGTGLLFLVIMTVAALVWLRWESHRPRDAWLEERQGRLADVTSSRPATTSHGQLTEDLVLTSDSGLRVKARLLRDEQRDSAQPVLIVLGGHRTGRNAIDLFGHAGPRAVVAMDYPYDGPERVRGVTRTIGAVRPVRRAILDTVPAVLLLVDWLVQQPWVDSSRIVIVGASLGVPFAATAAARDPRIAGAILVHGAADNRLWLEAQLARRIGAGLLHDPFAVILHWLAYGPVHDTRVHVAAIAPRPVVIVGARADERTPAGQTELLYELAGDPKRLRWTDGGHIEPDRSTIIEELLGIADEEMAFLVGPAR